jgi:hypothetical protein
MISIRGVVSVELFTLSELYVYFTQVSEYDNLPIQPLFGLHAVWYAACQLLIKPFLKHWSWLWPYRLSNVEIGFTAGVTGQQGILTPHIIKGPHVHPFSDLYFLWDWLLILSFPYGIIKSNVKRVGFSSLVN